MSLIAFDIAWAFVVGSLTTATAALGYLAADLLWHHARRQWHTARIRHTAAAAAQHLDTDLAQLTREEIQ